MRSRAAAWILTGVMPLMMAGSCQFVLPIGLIVEVVNDTDYDVDPNIKFDDDTGFFAGLFPSDELQTGILAPGESVSFNFRCSELGSIGADDPRQFVGPAEFEGQDTDILRRNEDFDCTSLIRFRFVGNADQFDVIVSVDGRVVD